MRSVLLALLLALVIPASANAKLTDDAQRVAAFTPVAEATFPGPCVGHVTVNLHADATLAAAGPSDGGGPRVAQAHIDGACVIDIGSGFTDYDFCLYLVHEYGHLTGLLHDDSHPNIMNGQGAYGDFPACSQAVEAAYNDYDRALALIAGDVSLIKGVRRGTPAYKRGVRWIVYTAQRERWLVSGTGSDMGAEQTDVGVDPPKSKFSRTAA